MSIKLGNRTNQWFWREFPNPTIDWHPWLGLNCCGHWRQQNKYNGIWRVIDCALQLLTQTKPLDGNSGHIKKKCTILKDHYSQVKPWHGTQLNYKIRPDFEKHLFQKKKENGHFSFWPWVLKINFYCIICQFWHAWVSIHYSFLNRCHNPLFACWSWKSSVTSSLLVISHCQLIWQLLGVILIRGPYFDKLCIYTCQNSSIEKVDNNSSLFWFISHDFSLHQLWRESYLQYAGFD